MAATADGRLRTIAVTHQRLLLLALLLASPIVARAAAAAGELQPCRRFESAPCPKLPGAEELAKRAAAISSCRRIAVGRTAAPSGSWSRIPPPAHRKSGPIPCLSRRRPGRHCSLEINALIAADFIRDRDIYVVSQRGTMFSEPALTCAQPTTSPESFSASASIPRRRSAPIWPRWRPVTANSPPLAPC